MLLTLFFLSENNIIIEDAYARVGFKGGATAVYMKIKNTSEQKDTLYKADCECAKVTMIHNTVKEKNKMKMVEVKELEIEKEVELKPGGLHIMLIDLKKDLKENDTIEVVLSFKKAGQKTIKVPVRKK